METVMAKGQKRPTKEVRKPKKKKEEAAAPMSFAKGISASSTLPKKKA